MRHYFLTDIKVYRQKMNRETKSHISKETIIAVAVPEFSERGYKEASLNRICINGRISKGKLYHHFKNKDELYLSVVEESYKKLTEHLLDFKIKFHKNIEDVFMDLYKWWQAFWKMYPLYIGIFIDSRRNPPFWLREQLVEMRRDTFIKPLKLMVRDIVLYYYPEDIKLQSILVGLFITLLDYTSTVGLSKIDIYDSSTSYLDAQVPLFKRLLLTVLYGAGDDRAKELY